MDFDHRLAHCRNFFLSIRNLPRPQRGNLLLDLVNLSYVPDFLKKPADVARAIAEELATTFRYVAANPVGRVGKLPTRTQYWYTFVEFLFRSSLEKLTSNFSTAHLMKFSELKPTLAKVGEFVETLAQALLEKSSEIAKKSKIAPDLVKYWCSFANAISSQVQLAKDYGTVCEKYSF